MVGAFDFASNLGEGNDLLLLSLLFWLHFYDGSRCAVLLILLLCKSQIINDFLYFDFCLVVKYYFYTKKESKIQQQCLKKN